MSVRIGIDTGGTFNDFVLVDEESGVVRTAKSPSTPSDPGVAIRAGLRELGVTADVDLVVVSTTVATNAVIERRGPTVLYVTDEGFADVPFIGRLDKERLYDLHWRKPRPLVRRRDCFGLPGRVDADGRVVAPLRELDLEPLLERVRTADRDDVVVAICTLFSYVRPDRERVAVKAVLDANPDVAVSASHEVSPVWREYERATTTIVDAFVKPVVRGYVNGVRNVLQDELGDVPWSLLASNGGHLRAPAALRSPVRLLLSGPAGGVGGGKVHAGRADVENAFTLDMGGTSADIGLILDGEPQFAAEFEFAWGLPVTVPCVSVSTIGAGGGSIAWVDKGGLLHVGPESAGAEPGPAAYARGGERPTLTDANIVLGRLDPDSLLGGAMPLDAGAAHRVYAALGERLGMSAEGAAWAAVATADENMANAVRLIAVDRGVDTRDFALVAFGGAGPLHARAVADRLGMPTLVVPPQPGLCSAFGAAIARARVDLMQTCYARSDRLDLPGIAAVDAALRERALAELRATAPVGTPALERFASLRYAGQNYEVEVRLPDAEIDDRVWAIATERFADAHEALYGFSMPGEVVELINLRAAAGGPEIVPPRSNGSVPVPARAHTRAVWCDESGPIDCPVQGRPGLGPGDQLTGPVIIAEHDSTTFVGPGDRVRVAGNTALVIELAGAR